MPSNYDRNSVLDELFRDRIAPKLKKISMADTDFISWLEGMHNAAETFHELQDSDIPLSETLKSESFLQALQITKDSIKGSINLSFNSGVLDILSEHPDMIDGFKFADNPEKVELDMLTLFMSPDPSVEWKLSFSSFNKQNKKKVLREKLKEANAQIEKLEKQLKVLQESADDKPTKRIDKWLKGLGKILRGTSQIIFNIWLVKTTFGTIELLGMVIPVDGLNKGIVIMSVPNGLGLLLEGGGELWPSPK